jgi:hypothetical protein
MTNLPFKLNVYVYRRPHMRDETLEMELHIGLGILRNLFDREQIDTATEHITSLSPSVGATSSKSAPFSCALSGSTPI